MTARRCLGRGRPEVSRRSRLVRRRPTFIRPPDAPIDKMEPADPIDRIEPVEPIDKMEPVEPIDRIDPVEPIDKIEPTQAIDLTEPTDAIDRIDPMLATEPWVRWSGMPSPGARASVMSRLGVRANP